MAAQEQRFFHITATLCEPSSRAYDRGTRHLADPQFCSCQGARSGKDIYVCLKITFLHYILTYGMRQYNVIVLILRNKTKIERPFPLYETPHLFR